MALFTAARFCSCKQVRNRRLAPVRIRFLIILMTCAVITLGQSAHAKKQSWISLFNGKDLTGWHLRNPAGANGWKVLDGTYVNTPPSTDIQTVSEYYDFQLHVEFKVSEGNGNSGVYMRDKYEVQIFNSFGNPPVDTGCGALYRRVAPTVNASKSPSEWQTYDITFIGKHLIVIHNGQKVLDVADVGPMGTGASSNRPDGPGPLRLQGDHDAVSFRNIRIRPLSKSEAEKLMKK
jgi:3-keto-disaccharide hydrolase